MTIERFQPCPLDDWLGLSMAGLGLAWAGDSVEHRELFFEFLEGLAGAWDADGITDEMKASTGAAASAGHMFWEIYYNPQKGLPWVEQLNALREKWRPQRLPDVPIDKVQAEVFLYISAALAVLLDESESGFSEEFRQVVQEAASVSDYLEKEKPSSDEVITKASEILTEEAAVLEASLGIVQAFIWCCRFHVQKAEGRSFESLESFYKALNACFWVALGPGDTLEGPNILSQTVSLALLGHWVPPQTTVDEFDSIYDSHMQSVDWAQLAHWCTGIGSAYSEARQWENSADVPETYKRYSVQSKHNDVFGGDQADQFWAFAQGLCRYRLSPDAYRALREKDEIDASQKRLRTYFFGNLWDALPGKAKEALISADREYASRGGRRSIIFDHLRHAVRALLAERIYKQYQLWLKARPTGHRELKTFADIGPLLESEEPDLRPMLQLWKSPDFMSFMDQCFKSEDAEFLKGLENDLAHLNWLANEASHKHSRSHDSFEDDVNIEIRKFLGIGEQSIIRGLLWVIPLSDERGH